MGAVLANPKDFIAGKATAGFGGGEGTHLWSLPFPQDFFFFFFNSQQAGYGQKLLPVAISAVDKLKLDGVDAALVSSSV